MRPIDIIRLLPCLAALGGSLWLLSAVLKSGADQHAMFCKMAQDFIETDTGLLGFEDALAGWRKFQIEDGCAPPSRVAG